jgi:hypothetical protein
MRLAGAGSPCSQLLDAPAQSNAAPALQNRAPMQMRYGESPKRTLAWHSPSDKVRRFISKSITIYVTLTFMKFKCIHHVDYVRLR